jgi:amino acid permease
MLDKLRPRIWKQMLASLLIIGMVYIRFYDLVPDFNVTLKETITGTIGLAALFLVWFDYYVSMKTYRKYQDILISMTEPRNIR